MKFGRHLHDQGTALRAAIHATRRNFNPVMRIGALSEGRAEKAALERSCAPSHRAGKSLFPQRVWHHVKRPQFPLAVQGDASGVFTPAPPMPEPGLGMAGPRNEPSAMTNPDDADNRSRLSLATIPMRANGRSSETRLKVQAFRRCHCGSSSTGDGLCLEGTMMTCLAQPTGDAL